MGGGVFVFFCKFVQSIYKINLIIMNSFFKRPLPALIATLLVGAVVSACGTDEPEDSNNPDIENPGQDAKLSGPTSITYGYATMYTISYDDENRMTYLRTLQGEETFITYSPLTYKTGRNGSYTTFEDITVNSQGYITGYKYDTSKSFEDGIKTITCSATYDDDGHMTKLINHDPERGDYEYHYTWKDNNLTSIYYCHQMEGEENITQLYTFTYNGQKNSQGIYCPMWPNGLSHFTGLYGKAPAEFPSTISLDSGNTLEYIYELLPDGRIHTETFGNSEETRNLEYHY